MLQLVRGGRAAGYNDVRRMRVTEGGRGEGGVGVGDRCMHCECEGVEDVCMHCEQCCGSGSVLDPNSGVSWIRICIRNTDPVLTCNYRIKWRQKMSDLTHLR